MITLSLKVYVATAKVVVAILSLFHRFPFFYNVGEARIVEKWKTMKKTQILRFLSNLLFAHFGLRPKCAKSKFERKNNRHSISNP